jgi:ketol-acid reductoisomerase
MKIYCDQDADLNDLKGVQVAMIGRRIEAEHPIEEVGEKLRGLMSRLKE